jgi:hypothetical protein
VTPWASKRSAAASTVATTASGRVRKRTGCLEGRLDVIAPYELVGGVVVHHRLEVSDHVGGLLQDKLGFGGHGFEIVRPGEAVAGEVADDGFDVAHDAGGAVLKEMRLSDGGLEVIRPNGWVRIVLLAGPRFGPGRSELGGAGVRQLFHALQTADAGGDAV